MDNINLKGFEMYNIKDIIKRMKQISNIESNANLARNLNVSYNTFNTWLKRNKFPQETIIEFAKRYNTSLDYLIFGKDNNNNRDFIFYGQYEQLNIYPGSKLNIDKNILHSNGYYLIKQRDIYYIAQAFFNPFTKIVTLKTPEFTRTIKEEDFNNINIGLIINIHKTIY